jgi:acetyl esterase/lipase
MLGDGTAEAEVGADILSLPAPPADLRLAYGPDPLQFGDLRLPAGAGPHPVAVVIHGGFWRAQYDLTHIGHLCAALTSAGVATWNVEYRRIGNPGGGWPGTFHDVARATDHLRELAPAHALDLERVVTLGHSAGGHLALWLAARHRIPAGDVLASPTPLPLHAAISLAGVSDLELAWELRLRDGIVRALLGGAPEEVPERYATASPVALLPLGVPQVLIHGTDDESVPFIMSERYQAKAAACGDAASLIALPGAGHFELIDPRSREWPEVQRAVLPLLRIG